MTMRTTARQEARPSHGLVRVIFALPQTPVSSKTRRVRRMSTFATVLGVSILACIVTAAQESDPGEARTRNLWNEAFKEQRPQSPAPKHSAAATPEVKQLGTSFIGLTLWRMRSSIGSDPVRIRGLAHRPIDPQGTLEWTPQRMSFAQPVQEGDYVRLTIESARPGYLYVIDRDVYRNAMSAPTLRFPTKRLRGGDNRVEPGVPIEIPDAHDAIPVFTIERTRSDQNGVMLTVIVTQQPIQEIKVEDKEQQLTDKQVKDWEKRWGSQVQQIEDRATTGQVYSSIEKTAVEDPTKPLLVDDPLPFTLFHCAAKADQPMLVSVPIQIRRSMQ